MSLVAFRGSAITGSATVAVARRGFSAIPEQKLVAFVLALIVAVQHRLDTTPNSLFTLGKATGAPVAGRTSGRWHDHATNRVGPIRGTTGRKRGRRGARLRAARHDAKEEGLDSFRELANHRDTSQVF